MPGYIPDLIVRAIMADREREVRVIARLRAAKAAGCPSGLRAGFASRLARIALTLHREAATAAGLQPRTESPRRRSGPPHHRLTP